MSEKRCLRSHSLLRAAVLVAVVAGLLAFGLGCAKVALPLGASKEAMAPPPPGAGPAAPGQAEQALETADRAVAPSASPVPPEGGSAGKPAENSLDPNQVRAQQKIIYTARYGIRVEKAQEAAKQVRTLAEKAGGFVSNLNQVTEDSGNTRVRIELRIPSENFMEAVSGLDTLGKLEEKNISTENVTEEWVDLQARLGIKELRKQQLEALLKRAGSVDEIDSRQQQILAVQEEIERIQGRMRLLQNQVVLSTVTVELYEKGLAPVQKPGPFSSRNVLQGAWYALLVIAQVVYTLIVYLALPGAILWVPALVIYLVRRRRQQPPPPTG